MKKFFNGANIQAVLMVLVSIAETVIISLYTSVPAIFIVFGQISSIIGVVLVRFSYEAAWISNIFHSIFNRKNSFSIEEDEPNDFAVFGTKFGGYFAFALQIIMIFDW